MVESIIGREASPEEKLRALQQYFKELGSVAVAFSSGVDSTFLLKVAHDTLGDKAFALTARSSSYPVRETKEAEEFCRKEGIKQIIYHADELSVPGFKENPKNRCYICKKSLFTALKQKAAENGTENLAEGSNLDDDGDYRPGLMAVAELGVLSPLRVCSLTKEEIRGLSRKLELPTWDKPSYACLASRFVYGETITEKKLSMVDQAEQMLFELGFRQSRVRIHGTMARIEILPSDFSRLVEPEVREKVVHALKKSGFSYVTMDLAGYRMGSMNETILNGKDGN